MRLPVSQLCPVPRPRRVDDVPDGEQLLFTIEESRLTMSIFVVTDWVGEPRNVAPREHAEMRWFGRDDLEDLAVADHRLRRRLAAVLDDTS